MPCIPIAFKRQTVSAGDKVEIAVAVVVFCVLVACGFASVPVPSRITEEEAIAVRREKMRVAEIEGLRTQDGALQGEVDRLTKVLESTKADLASFRQVHDTLIAQVALTTAKMQDVEGKMLDAQAQAEKASASTPPCKRNFRKRGMRPSFRLKTPASVSAS